MSPTSVSSPPFSSNLFETNIVMPQRVVLRSAAAFAGLLGLSQLALIAFHFSAGEPVPAGQPLLVAILISVVALPLICYSALSAERSRAMLTALHGALGTDTLTGIRNRTGFYAAVDTLMNRLSSALGVGAVLFIDADRFKSLNDRYGHHVGDQALVIIGAALREGTRETDIYGRLGGEEFAVVLRDATFEQAGEIAERIRADIEDRGRALNQPGLTLTVSIGLAIHAAGQSFADCLKEADKRLYEAKTSGRNRVEAHLKLVGQR